MRGAFHAAPGDGVPDGPGGARAGTVVLLGWTGGVQWPAFAASAEAGDRLADPLNRWTRRLLSAAARVVGGWVVHPGDGPPFLPFQRWAMTAEGIGASPLGLLVHPRWGLWHAYRGALVVAERWALAEVAAEASPCEGCGRPCLSACPVGAFSGAGHDWAGCAGHLAGGGDCLELRCRARLACPVRPGVGYGPAQMRFHMAALRVGLAEAIGRNSED